MKINEPSAEISQEPFTVFGRNISNNSVNESTQNNRTLL